MILYGVIIIMGLIVGLLINVCIQRIPLGQSLITPPMWERCRFCRENLSARCLLVELVSVLASVVLFSKYGLTVDFAAFLFLIYILITVFFIDLDHQIIPNRLVIVGLIGGATLFVYNLFLPFQIYADDRWWNPLLGLVSGSGFLFGVSLIGLAIYKGDEVMGMGDVKLFAPIGLFLGWRMTLLALFISIISGGLTSLLLILFGKATRKSMIPFGPFIVIGTFITIMWGWNILHWYVNTYLY